MLRARTVSATPGVGGRAAGAVREPRRTQVVRIRSANQIALAIEQSFFPAEHFPDLLEHSLTGSLYGLLEPHDLHDRHTAAEYLEPVTAGAERRRRAGHRAGHRADAGRAHRNSESPGYRWSTRATCTGRTGSG